MKTLLPPAVLILALLCSPGSAPLSGEEEGEWIRPYPVHLPGIEPTNEKGEKTAVSIRLLREDRHGLRAAVVRGTASFYTEECDPWDTGARLLAEGRGDEFGFTNVFKPEDAGEAWEWGSHWQIEGPGQGAVHEFCVFGFFDGEEVILPGGVDREIRILDPFGRPLTGAKVSMFLGCPHSPTLRSGETDELGVVRLLNLPVDREGDFWIEAPGIRLGPYQLSEPWVGQGGATILTGFARTARGTVVDEDGGPVAGMVVRATGGYPRGPVTATGEDGGFVLHGVEWHHRLCFHRPDSPHTPRPDCIVVDFDEEVPLRVTLRASRPTALTDGEARHPVDVVALHGESWKTGEGAEVERQVETNDAPVVLSRESDGFTIRGRTGDGAFRAMVPAGRYVIIAGGQFSRHQAGRMEIELPRPAGEPVGVDLPGEQAGVDIDAGMYRSGEYPRPSTIELRIPGMVKDLSDWHQFYGLKAPEGPVGVFVSPPARILDAGGRSVDLLPPPKNRIRFRLVDVGGAAVDPGEVTIDWWDACTPKKQKDGSFVVETWACGRVRVAFGDAFFGRNTLAVDLPSDAAGLVDLGTVVLRGVEEDADGELRALAVRFADGNPVAGDDLHSCLFRAEDDGEDWEAAEVDDEGAFFVEKERVPLRVNLEGPHLYPLTTVVRPDGPSEIRLPPGRLAGVLRGPDGGALAGVVYVDSARYECPDGTFLVRGIPAGPHLVIAGARDHVGEVRRILLKDGESRDLRVHLSPR